MDYTVKTFESADAALANACNDLLQNGQCVAIETSEQGKQTTTELLNYSIVFEPWHDPVITNPIRNFPKRGAQAEFLWYMTGCRKASKVAKYLKNWLRFADSNDNVNSNYGCYWKDGIKWCIEELKRDKFSRRAVMNIYAHANRPFGKDTPCTLSLQFLIRNDKLHLICNMRSNDIWYGFCIDQYCNTMLHRLVLNELQDTYETLVLGNYYHNAGSFHAYDNTADETKLTDCKFAFEDKHKSNFILANVKFSNFWTKASGMFDDDIFAYFKEIAETEGNVNLIN